MKRTSSVYVKYLETLVIALLDEREVLGKADDILAPNVGDGSPGHYAPYNIREAIANAEDGVKDEWLTAISKAASALRFRAKEPDFPLTEAARAELLSISISLGELESFMLKLPRT